MEKLPPNNHEQEQSPVARFEALQQRFERIINLRASSGADQAEYVESAKQGRPSFISIGIYVEQLAETDKSDPDVALTARWGHAPGAGDHVEAYLAKATLHPQGFSARQEEAFGILELSARHLGRVVENL